MLWSRVANEVQFYFPYTSAFQLIFDMLCFCSTRDGLIYVVVTKNGSLIKIIHWTNIQQKKKESCCIVASVSGWNKLNL